MKLDYVQKKKLKMDVHKNPLLQHFYFHYSATGNPSPRERRSSEDAADISDIQLRALLRALSR